MKNFFFSAVYCEYKFSFVFRLGNIMAQNSYLEIRSKVLYTVNDDSDECLLFYCEN